MEPVDPVVQRLQTERFRSMTAERKLEITDQLIAFARELKASSLRGLHPDFSEEQVQARVTELFSNVAG